MNLKKIEPKKALNKAFLKVKPSRDEIEKFKTNLVKLLDQIKGNETEEFHKNIISEFLKNTYYGNSNYINTKGRYDLVIHNGKDSSSTVGVIIETKSPKNKNEMIRTANLDARAFHELIYYFLQERLNNKNLEIRFLIATNIYEWFIFDAGLFEENFARDKDLVSLFGQYTQGSLSGSTTDFFYKNIVGPKMKAIEGELTFTHFDIRDYDNALRNADKKDDAKLVALYKLLSPVHLLKMPYANDSNSLDKAFYTELLHLIGLVETKEGSKKLIERQEQGRRNSASLIENAIDQLDSLQKVSRLDNPGRYGSNEQKILFNVALELAITWVNRILFLKLLEAQLISYHKGDRSYAFLNAERVKNFDDLNSLFFSVLARKTHERSPDVKKQFANVPYLNSSLFEPTELEHSCFFISQLKDGNLPLISTTVLKDNAGKRRTGQLPIMEYFFEFLNAYDFAGESDNEIAEENKTLINASVLGLIFEKINGYKDGSFFTPGFITMYMCRETIRRAVVQKFNDVKGWKCTEFDELYDKIEDRGEANRIIDSLKICDPAVGSGHFLVSALNEIIAVKSQLKILSDREGKRLKEYQVEVFNDELVVSDEDGDPFKYNPKSAESRRVQEALFHEKQTIIESCLFGVDINPNSVKICRLRLWIELLKSAYYKSGDNELETLPNIDINIKCGNSLISRFPLDADIKQALKKSKWTIDSYRLAVMAYRNAASKEEKWGLVKWIEEIKKDFQSEVSRNDKRKIKLENLKDDLIVLTKQGNLFEMSKAEKESKEKKIKSLIASIDKLELELEEIRSNKIYENAFEWRFEFPEVLNDDGDFVGFDVVIGNPPYGAIFCKEQKAFISNTYSYVDYQIDIYMVFFELSEKIMRNNAKICFITPNTWLLNLMTPNIRKLLFTKLNLFTIKAFEKPVFEEAVVDTMIVVGEKSRIDSNRLEAEILKKNGRVLNNYFDKSKLAESFNSPLNIYLSNFAMSITEKTKNCITLGEVAKVTQGSKPFQIGKGKPLQDETILKEKPYVKEYKADETFRPLLRGSLINKYVNIWRNNYFISFGDWLAEPRYSADYDALKKIVIRQTGSDIIATIDYDQFIVRDNLYTIVSQQERYSEEFLLGILNSKFINWYYQNIINNEVGEALAQVKRGHLIILPIPIHKVNSDKEIEKLVTQILAAKKANPDADTSALEKEIDRLVYELYGLTEEEIKIVDGD